MERLDNLYYAQYANKSEASESAYDSDNEKINNCDESKYMPWRNEKESLHKEWLIQRHNLEQRYQDRMEDIFIKSSKNFVKYICKYKGLSEVLPTRDVTPGAPDPLAPHPSWGTFGNATRERLEVK